MQDNNSDFHRIEYVKLGNTMDTAKIEALKQMLSSRAGAGIPGKRKVKGKEDRRN